jgi:multiple sugar transport system substrate-binding protein
MDEKKEGLNRREFLKLAGVAAGAVALGGTLGETLAQSSKATKQLSVLYMNQAGYTTQVVTEMAKQFMSLYPDIRINLTFLPYPQMHDAITTSVAASTATYHVVLADLIWTAEFIDHGYVIPLNPYITPEEKQGIYQAIWNGLEYKGKIASFPFLANFQNFYYNREHLRRAGFEAGPRTIDEWVHQMEVIKSKGIVKYPYEDSWTQAEGLVCDYVRMAGMFGNGNLFEGGEPVMNRGPQLKALEFMVMLMQKGLANPASIEADEPTAARAFASGEASFNTNWTFVTGIMNDPKQSKIIGQGVVSTFPIVPGTNPKTHSASISGFQGIAIPANTPKELIPAAIQWIRFAASPKIQAEHLHSQWPVWKSVANSPAERRINPWWQVYQENLEAVYNRPKVPDYLHVSAIIQRYVHQALQGNLSPKSAADQMVQELKALGG